jgi:predicted Zn-dependent peptidase
MSSVIANAREVRSGETAATRASQPPSRPAGAWHNPQVPEAVPQLDQVSATDLANIEFSQRRLDNGLRVIVAPDNLAPVVAINLWYAVGSRHEQPGRTGFAHLFEHFMFQGSRHITKAEHFNIVQRAGGVNNATTYFDRTNYFETLPSHQYELGLWLEADRMATLLDALDQENLDNQREVVKNEKRQSYDNRPYGSFYEKLVAAVFPPEHPYHHIPIGSMEDLDAATLEDVISFFRDWYAPNNAVLSIVGDVDEEQAHAAAARYFGPIPANWNIRQPELPTIAPRIGREVRATVPDDVPLVRIHFGFRCPSYGTREWDALEVAAQILAGGKGSRLHRRLVREGRLAQDVTAFSLPLVAGATFFGGWATCRPDVPADVVEAAYLRELEQLGGVEPPTEDELARARALIEANELAALGRVEEVADRLSMYATLFDRPELINEQLPRYLSIGADEIRDVAREVFRTDNRVVLTYVARQ